MTELEEKKDIMIDILELNDDAQNILEALIEIATLDQFYQLKESFEEPEDERSDYDEHNTMSTVYHTPYSIWKRKPFEAFLFACFSAIKPFNVITIGITTA